MSALWNWQTCLPVEKRSRSGGIRRSPKPLFCREATPEISQPHSGWYESNITHRPEGTTELLITLRRYELD
jgi:hypothetical protein